MISYHSGMRGSIGAGSDETQHRTSTNHKSMGKVLAISMIAFCSLPCLARQNNQTSNINMAAGITDSQYPGGASSSADAQLELLSRRLALSQDQQDKIKVILERQQAHTRAINQDASLSQEDKMSKVENLNATTVNKVNEVLHDDQKHEYDELRQDMRVRSGIGQGSGRGQGSSDGDPLNMRVHAGRGQGIGQGVTVDDQLEFLAAIVPLSLEQQSQIKTLMKDEHTQTTEIYQDASLSRADKDAKVRSLGETTVAKVRNLLNADQQKKFDERPQDMYEIIAKGGRGSK